MEVFFFTKTKIVDTSSPILLLPEFEYPSLSQTGAFYCCQDSIIKKKSLSAIWAFCNDQVSCVTYRWQWAGEVKTGEQYNSLSQIDLWLQDRPQNKSCTLSNLCNDCKTNLIFVMMVKLPCFYFLSFLIFVASSYIYSVEALIYIPVIFFSIWCHGNSLSLSKKIKPAFLSEILNKNL